MRAALIASRDATFQIDAERFLRDFNGKRPPSSRMLCPLCHQDVSFVPGDKVIPYFRHKKNNPRAHACELYESGVGQKTPGERMSIPVVLRVDSDGKYRVFAELRPLGSHLYDCARKGSVLIAGSKRYLIKLGRFEPRKMTEVEVGIRSLEDIGNIRVEKAPGGFGDYFGKTSCSSDCAVFSIADGSSSKLLHPGDFVYGNEEYYLVAEHNYMTRVRKYFRSVEQIGNIAGAPSLVVTRVQFSFEKNGLRPAASQWLSNHEWVWGFAPATPEIVWPPVAVSRGVSEMLFSSNTAMVMRPAQGIPDESRLKVQTAHLDRPWEHATLSEELKQTAEQAWLVGDVRVPLGFFLICPMRNTVLDSIACIRDLQLALPDNDLKGLLDKSGADSGSKFTAAADSLSFYDDGYSRKQNTSKRAHLESRTLQDKDHLRAVFSPLRSNASCLRMLYLSPKNDGDEELTEVIRAKPTPRSDRDCVRAYMSFGLMRAIARGSDNPRAFLRGHEQLKINSRWRTNAE